jgi:DDE_Tnp_1-associated
VPADAASLIPSAPDQLREQPEVAPEEVPGLLERLARVPDPRDPRGVRHALVAVLALAACVVLAGATSLLAVSEWITDAPPHVLEHVGVGLDPLFPHCSRPAETTVRRLLARIHGNAPDIAVDRWPADPHHRAEDHLRGPTVDGKSLRGAAKAKGPQSDVQPAVSARIRHTVWVAAIPQVGAPCRVHRRGLPRRGEEDSDFRRRSVERNDVYQSGARAGRGEGFARADRP